MSIYLDYNGTTPVLPEVLEAMLPYLKEKFGNPGSAHAWGRAAKEGLELARRQVGNFIGAPPECIFFTSHATEADNMALNTVSARPNSRLVTTSIEHPAVLGPAAAMESRGAEVVRLPVDNRGVVRMEEAKAALASRADLVSVMLANNETGAIQPVEEIAALARERGTPVHVDAAQACGKIPVDVDTLGADYLAVAGHKLYAPKGVGALYARDPMTLFPSVLGGGQESGLRHGTENVAYIVGLGAACALAAKDLEGEMKRQRGLGKILLDGLSGTDAPWMLVAEEAPRLPNTMSLAFKGRDAGALVAGLDRLGVGVSAGAACHSDQVRISHVLTAMGLDTEWAKGAVRFSWGRPTTEEDMAEATRLLRRILESKGE